MTDLLAVLIIFQITVLPIQLDVWAFSFEHPCIQAPLKASHLLFLHLASHSFEHPSEYLIGSQPKKDNNNRRFDSLTKTWINLTYLYLNYSKKKLNKNFDNDLFHKITFASHSIKVLLLLFFIIQFQDLDQFKWYVT